MTYLDELEKLADLKKKKIITTEEFEEQKSFLLKKPSTKDPLAKEALAYYVLAWFLGYFGVHNFYIGRKGVAVTQLLLCVVPLFLLLFSLPFLFLSTEDSFCEMAAAGCVIVFGVLFILGIVVDAVWILMDVICVKNDGKGRPMQPAPTARVVFIIFYIIFEMVMPFLVLSW